MDRQFAYGLLPTLMLAVLLLGYRSNPQESAPHPQPTAPGAPESTQKPADSHTDCDVRIFSDTQGVDFGPYVRQILTLLKKN